MKQTIITALCAALGFALLLGLTGCGAGAPAAAPAAAPDEPLREITVSASGSVYLTPDKAAVTFGVTTQEATAAAAQGKNGETVEAVIAALAARGVEETSIRTTYYGMYPRYDWTDGVQRLIGYTVTSTLTVQDQDIGTLGELLSACVAAGVNQIDSISFLCSGYDEAYREALALAVAASRDKAEALAAAAGMTLGEAVAVTEGWQDSSARYARSADSFPAAEAMDAGAPVLQPGQTGITANVTVTYRMS